MGVRWGHYSRYRQLLLRGIRARNHAPVCLFLIQDGYQAVNGVHTRVPPPLFFCSPSHSFYPPPPDPLPQVEGEHSPLAGESERVSDSVGGYFDVLGYAPLLPLYCVILPPVGRIHAMVPSVQRLGFEILPIKGRMTKEWWEWWGRITLWDGDIAPIPATPSLSSAPIIRKGGGSIGRGGWGAR